MDRFAAFAASGERFTPREPHYYLGMIGVLPELQGRGLARLILDEVHALSENDPGSTGVLLTTETERNLPLYERFGYTVIGRAEVEDLISWSLFRPDP
jgi:ribosomal protein S18 acetylase RimI-like enzyme